MWIFLLLLVGLAVAVGVLANEMRKLELARRLRAAWTAFTAWEEEAVRAVAIQAAPAELPTFVARHERWCRGAVRSAVRCQDRPVRGQERRARKAPVVSDVAPKASPRPASVPPSGLYLASRPGVLVDPTQYEQAPPLPPTPSSGPDFEIDLDDFEDLVDTTPSKVLTAAEAEAILAQADELEFPTSDTWARPELVPEQRDTQPQITASLADIPIEPQPGAACSSATASSQASPSAQL